MADFGQKSLSTRKLEVEETVSEVVIVKRVCQIPQNHPLFDVCRPRRRRRQRYRPKSADSGRFWPKIAKYTKSRSRRDHVRGRNLEERINVTLEPPLVRRAPAAPSTAAAHTADGSVGSGEKIARPLGIILMGFKSVSYTHLTLPTICSV